MWQFTVGRDIQTEGTEKHKDLTASVRSPVAWVRDRRRRGQESRKSSRVLSEVEIHGRDAV